MRNALHDPIYGCYGNYFKLLVFVLKYLFLCVSGLQNIFFGESRMKHILSNIYIFLFLTLEFIEFFLFVRCLKTILC